MRRCLARWVAGLVLCAGTIQPALAQESDDWNDARSLELVAAARARRAVPRADSGLTSYQARATGYVYFYLDRRDSAERTLVKTDQIALNIFWATPDRTKQHIVGLRDASSLPNGIRYHMDHLTVVQDEFGDVIRLGDGDEVRDVPHPAAPRSDQTYDFRLADSLSIRLTGRPEPIRVYEIQVRPRRFDSPAFVGSLFIDRSSAAIVRMSFTFTPASYVDRRLDYIRISLDNGLWDERYWLPHEQKLEIRRQLPEIDFPTGGVIRGVLRIGDYRFNEAQPDNFFAGRPVLAFPEGTRERFPFEDELHAEVDAEGLGTPAELEDLRRVTRDLVGARRLSGLPGLRLRLNDASSFLRYNRAEGVRVGAGLVWAPRPETRIELGAGYAAGRRRADGMVAAERPLSEGLLGRIELYHERRRDQRPSSRVSGAMNSLHAALADIDYWDPFFVSGGLLRLRGEVADGWTMSGEVSAERHRSAALVVGDEPPGAGDTDGFRPVRAVEKGVLGEAAIRIERPHRPGAARSWDGSGSLALGTWDGDVFLQPEMELAARVSSGPGGADLETRLAAGAALGSAPPQRLYSIGGLGSIPGFAFRSFGGDRYFTAAAEASFGVLGPWIRPRLLAHLGWAEEGGQELPAEWGASPTDGVRASFGLGVGLIHDILRVDVARGLDGGEWQTLVSVRPRLRDFL
ncbi:MAG: hypothetical protein ABFS34_05800 [Gemmatimonadota bacterium]